MRASPRRARRRRVRGRGGLTPSPSWKRTEGQCTAGAEASSDWQNRLTRHGPPAGAGSVSDLNPTC